MTQIKTVTVDAKDLKELRPLQIELFCSTTDDSNKFNNLLTLYDQVPHYSSDKMLQSSTAKTTIFSTEGQSWHLETSPAVLLYKGNNISRFSGRREELIMAGLMSLAASNAVMFGSKIGVPFYLRELARTISEEGTERYSRKDIKLSLRILKNSNYRLTPHNSEGNKDSWNYSQLSEVMESASEAGVEGGGDRYFVVFNHLLTQQILNMQLRLYNFERFKKFHSTLSWPLNKRLCLRFTYAASDTTYTIRMSTLRELGSLPSIDSMPINKRRTPVINAFKELIEHGVLERYELVKTIKARSLEGPRRRLKTIDEEYKLTATKAFVAEQKKASAINNEIKEKLALG